MRMQRADRHADDVHTVHRDAPGAGHIQTGHDAHQTGFARLRGAEQDGDRIRAQVHIQCIQPRLRTHSFAYCSQTQVHLTPLIVRTNLAQR